MARTAPPAIAADLDAVRADMATADIVRVSRARVVRFVRARRVEHAPKRRVGFVDLFIGVLGSSVDILTKF